MTLPRREFLKTSGMLIVSFSAADANAVQEIAETNNAPFTILGRVGGPSLTISINRDEVVSAEVSDLEAAWKGALESKLQAEVVGV